MRLVPIFVMSSVALGTAAVAAGPPSSVSPELTGTVRSALQAMLPPGQASRPTDPDRGDDNASLRAIQLVCGHDNPSATRSAICPTPVSPD
jgi:hypothetical protein